MPLWFGRMRSAVVVLGLTGAFALYSAALIFDLNGDQYGWWRGASLVAAVCVLAATVWVAVRLRLPVAGVGRREALALVAGVALVVVSAVTMSSRYSDPYAGPRFWPDVLALFALGGLLLVLAAVVASLRPGSRKS